MYIPPSPDPEILKLSGDMKGIARPRRVRAPRHGPGEKFIKGPIPWTWVHDAIKLKGSALAVALLIWREAGIQRTHPIKMCQGWAEDIGIDRQAARRGIRALNGAGLIDVTRPRGRCLEVTILAAPLTATAGHPTGDPDEPK